MSLPLNSQKSHKNKSTKAPRPAENAVPAVVPPKKKVTKKKVAKRKVRKRKVAKRKPKVVTPKRRVEPRVKPANEKKPTKAPRPAEIAVPLIDNTGGATVERSLSEFQHSNAVNSVAFFPDGKLIASASDDFTVKLWNAASSKLIRTFKGHEGNVSMVAFSPDGRKIVSSSWDSNVILWDVKSGQRLQTFSRHTGRVYSVAYSHDGKRIASGGEDIVNVWDPASGQWRQRRSGHLDSITSVAFWPKRNRMASGSFDKRIVFYSFAYKDNLPRRFLKGHSDKVTSLAFLPMVSKLSVEAGISWQSFGVHLLRKRYEVFTGTAARFYAWLSHPMEN